VPPASLEALIELFPMSLRDAKQRSRSLFAARLGGPSFNAFADHDAQERAVCRQRDMSRTLSNNLPYRQRFQVG
jgi:hypothetical protein